MDSKLIKTIKWILGIIFVLSGIGNFHTSPIVGIISMLLGLFILPFTYKIISNKLNVKINRSIKILIVLILFIILIVSILINVSNIKDKELKKANNIVEQADQKIDSLKIDEAYELLFSVKYAYENNDNKACKLMKEIEFFRNDIKKTLIDMSDEDFNKLKTKSLDKKYLTQKTLNKIFVDTLYSLINKRNDFIAEFELKKLEEQIKKEQIERSKKIESQFSTYDGSHINLEKYIKKNMNDPDSYEHLETTYKDKGKYIQIITKFRGKNAFGGKVLNSVVAKVDINGDVIEAINLY